MEPDLPVLLAGALAFGIAMYVITDGFDLGVGTLFLLAPSDSERNAMMGSIAPFWDGNETWLVLGGTLLIAAFPLAYATLLPAFYVPLVMMLLALIFRGIAFEFRFRAGRLYRVWDSAFSAGSILAGFCQGIVLGSFIDGIPVKDGRFAGTTFGFLSPFAIACGLGLVAGYALLGATWLIFRTTGATQAFGRHMARPALLATGACIALISLWTPIAHGSIAQRWFSVPDIAFLWPVPAVTAAIAYGIWRAVALRQDARPFIYAIGLFLLALLGLGISLWPYAVPYSATLWQASSSQPTQRFVAIGVAIILPLNVGYLAYTHWVFRPRRRSEQESG